MRGRETEKSRDLLITETDERVETVREMTDRD